jgi:hypothetical protein
MKIDIMPRDTNFAFNLSHVRLASKQEECVINRLKIGTLAQIFTYLPWKEAFNVRLDLFIIIGQIGKQEMAECGN